VFDDMKAMAEERALTMDTLQSLEIATDIIRVFNDRHRECLTLSKGLKKNFNTVPTTTIPVPVMKLVLLMLNCFIASFASTTIHDKNSTLPIDLVVSTVEMKRLRGHSISTMNHLKKNPRTAKKLSICSKCLDEKKILDLNSK
jgi:hypothetical protein